MGGQNPQNPFIARHCKTYCVCVTRVLCEIFKHHETLLDGDLDTVFSINIMSCKEGEVIFSVCVFLQKCFQLRKNK